MTRAVSRTFAVAGGGTGGHIIPALAVAERLRSRGYQPFFIGTRNGMEARLVPAAGFEMEWVNIGGFNHVSLLRKLRTLLQLPVSTLRVWRTLGTRRPAAMFSTGGYVAGPAVIAALLRRLPIVIMEPNAVPGLTNRRISRWTARALVNFEETLAYFPDGRAELSGIPVRDAFFHVPPKPDDCAFTILVTGGSQGSRTLNEAGRGAWSRFAAAGVRVLHQAGRKQHEDYRDAFSQSGVSGELWAFVEDMPSAFAQADLIVSRSGASTVSEIAVAKRPSILVPFPFAADDHQKKNAEAMARAGAARMVLDSQFTPERLFEEVMRLYDDRLELRAMGARAGDMARPFAAERAATVLEEVGVSARN